MERKSDKLDVLLRSALTPAEEPGIRLNQKILNAAAGREGNCQEPSGLLEVWGQKSRKQRKRQGQLCLCGRKREDMERMEAEEGLYMEKRKMRRMPAIALTAAILIGAGSLTAYGAYRYLTLSGAVEELGDKALAEAFSGEYATVINETQSYGGYDVTLMGIASGENLSEWVRVSNGMVQSDRTYAMVAIARSDGSPMPDFGELENGDMGRDFFVSPLIQGYDPAFCNIMTMRGNYSEMLSEGVVYRLVECGNVEVFADRELYLCILGGTSFYDRAAYLYNEETGAISRNEAYDGLNALFSLPIDASKADAGKAEALIEGLGMGAGTAGRPEDVMKAELGDDFAIKTEEGNEKGAEAAEYALTFVGNPYVWGGESLTEGCDSSGFTKGVYEHFGVSLPHAASEQRDYGEEVEGPDAARPGDLFFYDEPSHVAVYIGDNKIVHADTQYGICVSEADYDEIAAIRRIF